MDDATISARCFKTAWFAKAAKKQKITDKLLCVAISQILRGQADDLGGGVFKKRLGNNAYRAILLAKCGDYWVYEYLFAKKDQANIDEAELRAFRQLAKVYSAMTPEQANAQITDGHWIEICNDNVEHI